MDLDKEYRPADVERRWSQEWLARSLFTARPDSGRPPFTMVIPPPNVTGNLHIGHVLVYTLHDVVARWRRMQGYDVLWLPGTDHAGIATQMVVERELAREGIDRRALGRKAFVSATPPKLAQCGGQDEVWIRSYASGRIELSATLQCRGMVVLADTYFPGWVAKVDGKTEPVYEVDGLVRGVVCDSGPHNIELVYRPASVLLGGALSFGSLLAAAAALVRLKRAR